MNLLFISLGREYGGTEVVVQNLIDNLVDDRITVVCFKNSRFSNVLKSKYNNKKRINIIELEYGLVNVLNNINIIRNLILKEKFELAHIHSIISNLFFQLANFRLNLPSIITVHSRSDFDRKNILKGYILNNLEIKLLNKNSIIVSVSSSIKDYLIKKGLNKSITVIHNGSRDLKKYEKKDNKLFRDKCFNKEDLIIGFVGRLTEVKGIYNLMDIVYETTKVNKNIKFIVIGEGALREYIDDQIELKQLDNLKILGFKNDIENYIPYFDMLIVPSNMEGIPLIILEAMSCGVPCIGSNVGGIPEIINDKIGFLYDNKNKLEAVLKLDFIEKNRYLLDKMKDNCLKEFFFKWNIKNAVKKYKNEYKKIIIDDR